MSSRPRGGGVERVLLRHGARAWMLIFLGSIRRDLFFFSQYIFSRVTETQEERRTQTAIPTTQKIINSNDRPYYSRGN